jgi:hypothetical protein
VVVCRCRASIYTLNSKPTHTNQVSISVSAIGCLAWLSYSGSKHVVQFLTDYLKALGVHYASHVVVRRLECALSWKAFSVKAETDVVDELRTSSLRYKKTACLRDIHRSGTGRKVKGVQ